VAIFRAPAPRSNQVDFGQTIERTAPSPRLRPGCAGKVREQFFRKLGSTFLATRRLLYPLPTLAGGRRKGEGADVPVCGSAHLTSQPRGLGPSLSPLKGAVHGNRILTDNCLFLT
jgi:hypothetical protein